MPAVSCHSDRPTDHLVESKTTNSRPVRVRPSDGPFVYSQEEASENKNWENIDRLMGRDSRDGGRTE